MVIQEVPEVQVVQVGVDLGDLISMNGEMGS